MALTTPSDIKLTLAGIYGVVGPQEKKAYKTKALELNKDALKACAKKEAPKREWQEEVLLCAIFERHCIYSEIGRPVFGQRNIEQNCHIN